MLLLKLSFLFVFFELWNSTSTEALEAKVFQNVFDGISTCASPSINLGPFKKVTNLYYYLEDKVKANWFEAANNCRKKGAHLAVIDSPSEMTKISKYLSDEGYRRNDIVWIGANDLAKEGRFQWESSGEDMAYAKWSKNQPDNGGGNENCVHLWIFQSDDWTLNDRNCINEGYYLCQLNEAKTITMTIW